jgi:hypothetical protein
VWSHVLDWSVAGLVAARAGVIMVLGSMRLTMPLCWRPDLELELHGAQLVTRRLARGELMGPCVRQVKDRCTHGRKPAGSMQVVGAKRASLECAEMYQSWVGGVLTGRRKEACWQLALDWRGFDGMGWLEGCRQTAGRLQAGCREAAGRMWQCVLEAG